ncbi:MAG: hypothetical protein JSV88_12130, partial [Candidatus Aminicenantes bacterium]
LAPLLKRKKVPGKKIYSHMSYMSCMSYIYRSGDLARWLTDGNIEFLGRIDHQFKIRGFRIEVGEIESQLSKHPEVKEALVLAKGDDDKYLCAYIVSNSAKAFDKSSSISSGLRKYLSQSLPDYMIPSYFVYLEQIPLTPSGKIDRKALPKPEPEVGQGCIAPRDLVEKRLAELWSGVLGIEKHLIGIDSNFFELGGHSLKATILITGIHKELDVKLPLAEIFKRPTIRGISDFISNTEESKYLTLDVIEEKEYNELSYNQKRLWLLNRLQPGGSSFNMLGRIELRHHVNENIIKKSMGKIIERHESLRTGFRIVDWEPVQYVEKEIGIPFKKIDLSLLDEGQKQREREQVYSREQKTPFDLNEVPLFRSILIKLDEDHYDFIFNMHHIITDGWSLEILKKEFSLYYDGFRNGNEYEPGELKIQYKDFAAWDNKQLADPLRAEQSRRFWKEKLQEGIPTLDLPIDPGGDRNDRAGAGYRCMLDKDTKDKLKELAQNNRATLFMVMFSIYLILLYHLSKQEKIGCSIIAANRENLSVQSVVGFFVNSILFNIDYDVNESFVDFLHRVSTDIVDIFRHQWYPIELIFKELKMKYPDVPVSFNMLNIREELVNLEIEGVKTGHIENSQDVKFDMEIYVSEYDNGISLFWTYKKSLLDPLEIEFLVEEYIKLINYFIDNFNESYSQYRSKKKKRIFKRND